MPQLLIAGSSEQSVANMIADFTIAHRGCRRNPEAVDNADHAADRGCMLQRKFLRSDVFEFTFEKKNAVRVEGNFLADACVGLYADRVPAQR